MLILGAGCGRPVVQYTTTDEVRTALAPADIGCRDFAWEPPPTAVACSFSEWVPQEGLKGGTVVIYADMADAAEVAQRCREGADDGGQLLYRDGQGWVLSVAAYASDRRTASAIDDREFVIHVAGLLGTDVINC